MIIPRRRFLHLAASTALLPALTAPALAQTYPNRPVRLIVGLAPGGVNDLVARLLAQWLTEHLGQTFVVENRLGFGGNIATAAVAKSTPDGYTLLLLGSGNPVNAALYPPRDFDLVRDIAPVAIITRQPNAVVVSPSMPVKTIAEFVAYAKANPGKMNMASTGSGTPSHVAGELFKMMTGAPMTHVPYRGGAPAVTDLIAGQVQIYFGALASGLPLVRAGKLRALAVTSSSRVPVLPDVPTVAETIPGYEATGLFGIGAPAGTPPAVIETLNKAINAGLANPKVVAKLVDLGGYVLRGTPADFGSQLVAEIAKWKKVIAFAGIKPE